MASVVGFKLGCEIPEKPDPAIQLSSITTSRIHVADDYVVGQVPLEAPNRPVEIPREAQYLKVFNKWNILGNDSYGNCNAVAWANQRRVVTSKLGSSEKYPDIDQVFTFYQTQQPNSQKDKPEPPDEGGMNMQTGLNYLVKSKGPDGSQAVAFAWVEPTAEKIRAAIATFGCCWLAIRVFGHNQAQCDKSEAWTAAEPNSVQNIEGHAVLAGAYDAQTIRFVTWGREASLDESFWKKDIPVKLKAGDGTVKTSTVDPVYQAWVVIWPEDVGTRSFMTGVNVKQLVSEYKRLTGDTPTLPVTSFNSLYFIKHKNPASRSTEVHTADAKASFGTLDHAITSAMPADAALGTWNVENKDAYFVKTKNTQSGSIEVYRLPFDKHYESWDIQKNSGFTLADGQRGTFTIDNGDLYFIKTREVGGSCVEVHMCKHQIDFRTVDYQGVSKFSIADVDKGLWTIRGGNLYFIKTKQTRAGKIEVHVSYGDRNYDAIDAKYDAWFPQHETENGTWDIGAEGDLYFVKLRNIASNSIEIHIATAKSKYQEVWHYATGFAISDAENGSWCV